MQAKYLVLVNEYGNECAILIDPALNHSDASGHRLVVAAGFCQIIHCDEGVKPDCLAVSCWGRSVTVGSVSRGDVDARLIVKALTSILP